MLTTPIPQTFPDPKLNGFRVENTPDGSEFVHIYDDSFFFHVRKTNNDGNEIHTVMHLTRKDLSRLLDLERQAGR